MKYAAADFLELFDTAVRKSGNRQALKYFDACLSYTDLDRQTNAFARHLIESGLEKGDRIILCLQNVPGFVIAFLGAAKAGMVTVPINPMYRQRELQNIIEDCQPSLLVCYPDFLSIADEAGFSAGRRIVVKARDRQQENPAMLPEEPDLCDSTPLLDDIVSSADHWAPVMNIRQADQPLLMVYTSGTTGKPKGVVLSHANMCAAASFYLDAAELNEDDTILAAAPLFHVTGLSGHIGAAIAAGCPLVLGYRFFADNMLDLIEQHQPTFTVAAVTALSALIDCPTFSRTRAACFGRLFSGGAPVPPSLAKRIEENMGVSLRNVYGLTETSAPVIATPAGEQPPVDATSGALSIGKPVAGSEICLLDEKGALSENGATGEIAVRGPSVFRAYWNKPEETKNAFHDGWFLTGDMGRQDEAGWYYLVDRKKDMIVASGFKVWPREIEDVLYSHPAVREAGVVGVPDPYRGETVKAVLSLHTGTELTVDEIIAYCRSRMAAYKVPRSVEFVDDLPKTLTGKIIRRDLK